MSLSGFIPKSIHLLRNYTFATFKKDLMAGLTVALIALPFAMAFAIASGVAPERGLYTAIIAGFVVSLLGGSRVQIAGPTGAFVVIISGIVQRTGYEGLCISTLIAAVLLVLAGALRIGSWIRYVPQPVVVGFTTGIAVVIFSTQVKDFFGLQMGVPPAEFVAKWWAYLQAMPMLNWVSLFVAVTTLTLVICTRKFFPKWPWAVGAIAIVTGVCSLFSLPIETIASRFGQIPNALPLPSFPSFSLPSDKWPEILTDALTIAFLGGVESLLSAIVGDRLSGGKHRSNCELIAQGIANIGSIVFGGIPATGAIARTAANVKTGGQTPMAGMIHALFMFLILSWLAPLVSQIPLAALAAVLMVVAWNMSEVHHFARIFRTSVEDRIILLTAFLLTIFTDITIAVSASMIIACLLFTKRMSQSAKICESVVHGPVFFGTAALLKEIKPGVGKFVLHMHNVSIIDASGMYALEELHQECAKNKVELELCGLSENVHAELKKFGIPVVVSSK